MDRPEVQRSGAPGWVRTAVLAVPPLVLAAAGVTHPMELTRATAHHWLVVHVALVPVFPLLAVAVWVLLARDDGVLAWLARGSAFVYAAFYGALDAVNGVAAGVLVAQTPVGEAADPTAALRPVLRIGNQLGWVGSSAFLVAVLLTVTVLLRRPGRRPWLGAVVVVAASVSFLDSHVYWPRGVVTMVLLAAGLVLLEPTRARQPGWSGPVRPVDVRSFQRPISR
ncbi:hypothetical protein [Microlunatus sagamiharensis]|nr:hypothetical protein [Microlunatus sagamiharensis]